jgi:hypothetical protein
MPMTRTPAVPSASPQAGFTLVEALTAIVILVFGLMAITNLFLVASTSTSVANQGTAATVSASRILDMLKSSGWDGLTTGGDATSTDQSGAVACANALPNSWKCLDDVPGVGTIFTRWEITGGTSPRVRYIRVRSEGTGAMSGARSRAEFTTFRSCTDSTAPVNCPTPAP